MQDQVIILFDFGSESSVLVFSGASVDAWTQLSRRDRAALGHTLGLVSAGQRPDGLQTPWQSDCLVCPGDRHQAIMRRLGTEELAGLMTAISDARFDQVGHDYRRPPALPSPPHEGHLVFLIEPTRNYGNPP